MRVHAHKALLITSIRLQAAQHDMVQHLLHHVVDDVQNMKSWVCNLEPMWLTAQNNAIKHSDKQLDVL